jgi:hypothetical protein
MCSSHFYPENELDDTEIVTLTDEYGRSLECYIENSLETGDKFYLLLMPVDIPIVIVAWDLEDDEDDEEEDEDEDEESSNAYLLEDNDEIEEVFGDAKAVLAELELSLKHTAYTLTVGGDLPQAEEVITLELDAEGQPLEPEELQLLASFYHQEQKYEIYTPLDPLLFLATYDHRSGKIDLVSPENEDLQPILEELLFDEDG